MFAAATADADLSPAPAPIAAALAAAMAGTPAAGDDAGRRGRSSDPVIRYFEVLSDRSAGSGNLKLQCKFCSKVFKGSATRMRAHLACTKDGVAACPSVPEDVKAVCLAELQAKKEAKARLSTHIAEGQAPTQDQDGNAVAPAAVVPAAKIDTKTEWEFLQKHFEVLGKSSAGNRSLRCKYCGKEFKGSATRMRAHLAGTRSGVAPCPSVPADVMAACLVAVKGRQAAKEVQTRALQGAGGGAEGPAAKKQKLVSGGDGTGAGGKGRQLDPVVKHFTVLSDRLSGSNLTVKCKYCGKEFKGSATRMRAHLAGSGDGISACPSTPDPVRAEFLTEVKEKKAFKESLAQKMADVQPLPGMAGSSGASAAMPPATGARTATKNEGLDQHFDSVGDTKNGNRSLRCKYCNKTFQGSATRMRAHLAGTRNGISACPSVPAAVKEGCLNVIMTKRPTGAGKSKQDPKQAPQILGGSISSVPAAPNLTIDSLHQNDVMAPLDF